MDFSSRWVIEPQPCTCGLCSFTLPSMIVVVIQKWQFIRSFWVQRGTRSHSLHLALHSDSQGRRWIREPLFVYSPLMARGYPNIFVYRSQIQFLIRITYMANIWLALCPVLHIITISSERCISKNISTWEAGIEAFENSWHKQNCHFEN